VVSCAQRSVDPSLQRDEIKTLFNMSDDSEEEIKLPDFLKMMKFHRDNSNVQEELTMAWRHFCTRLHVDDGGGEDDASRTSAADATLSDPEDEHATETRGKVTDKRTLHRLLSTYKVGTDDDSDSDLAQQLIDAAKTEETVARRRRNIVRFEDFHGVMLKVHFWPNPVPLPDAMGNRHMYFDQ
jgi:hypothetical protein